MSGPLLLPTWVLLSDSHPELVATMRRYLEQVACVLRPGSVNGADLALRSCATFLVETAPEVTPTAPVTPWDSLHVRRTHVSAQLSSASCRPSASTIGRRRMLSWFEQSSGAGPARMARHIASRAYQRKLGQGIEFPPAEKPKRVYCRPADPLTRRGDVVGPIAYLLAPSDW